MTVQAFQPRSYDPPKFVAEDRDELAERVGELLYSAQCDYCGNSCYRIERVGHGSSEPIYGYSARCVTDPDKAPDDPWEGCGRGFPISMWEEDLVEF